MVFYIIRIHQIVIVLESIAVKSKQFKCSIPPMAGQKFKGFLTSDTILYLTVPLCPQNSNLNPL